MWPANETQDAFAAGIEDYLDGAPYSVRLANYLGWAEGYDYAANTTRTEAREALDDEQHLSDAMAGYDLEQEAA